MEIQTIIIDLFVSLALVSAAMVIISKNPIHSVIYLIMVFCNAAGLLALLKIEFIAMMFIIIYVGAIAVLFLFVVMMLNIKQPNTGSPKNWAKYGPIGGVISIMLVLVMMLGIAETVEITSGQEIETYIWSEGKRWTTLIEGTSNIQGIGMVIYTYYVYYFIMSSIILLVAMIGAIVLTMHKRISAAKKQQVYIQVAREFGEAIGYAR